MPCANPSLAPPFPLSVATNASMPLIPSESADAETKLASESLAKISHHPIAPNVNT